MLEDAGREQIADHLSLYSLPALVVWDEDHFIGSGMGLLYECQFLHPDRKLEAVVAVALVTL